MKPGELQSGGYGFYYKGDQREIAAQPADVLQNLQSVITPLVTRERSSEPAKPYKELVSSPVYFSNEKWQECLSSHGLIVDAEQRTLTVQSESVSADFVYDLTAEETAVLTSNSIEEHPVEKRIELLNNIIAADYRDKVTMEALDSDRRISIGLHPEVQEDLARHQQQEQTLFEEQPQQGLAEEQMSEGAVIDGRDLYYLNENRGWYKEGRHGREVEVSEIAVYPAEAEGKYRMTAVIDGPAARVFRQFPLPGTSLHRANVMRNQQHRPITAKAPVWGSFRISSFFSLLPQEARASVVSANPSR